MGGIITKSPDTRNSHFLSVSKSTRPLLKQAEKVARSRHTTLITGPTGTGKGVLARHLHLNGPRSESPFIAVSCAAIPKDLLESELFGHERGAFSGAVQQRKGKAEMADGGTLFLDEIGEMPLELQAKILSFLQDRSFYRVGGSTLIEVDVRLIAATHRDLHEMVQLGKFREDLYYRLTVLTMEIPPLRERKEDIPYLALQFIRKAFAEEDDPGGFSFTPEALDAVLNYAWPGNVRELENAMLRASTLVDPGERISLEHLPPMLSDRQVPVKEAVVMSLAGRSLVDIERQALVETLHHCNGNRAETARLLGISEKSVYNKIKRYSIRT